MLPPIELLARSGHRGAKRGWLGASRSSRTLCSRGVNNKADLLWSQGSDGGHDDGHAPGKGLRSAPSRLTDASRATRGAAPAEGADIIFDTAAPCAEAWTDAT